MSSQYPADALDVVVRLVNEGVLVGFRLRSEIKRLTGLELTHNALCGLVFRLRAKGRITLPKYPGRHKARPACVEPPAPRSHAPRVRKQRDASARLPVPVLGPGHPSPEISPLQLDPSPAAEVLRAPCRLVELQFHSCRWPLWKHHERASIESLYCGEVVREGQPYCVAHYRQSISKAAHPPSVRNAHHVKKSQVG